uniref:MULE transposase domain-containing protein n=1 Tax=Setaria italica TaxID=4555 RepID=K3XQJ4_SETIT
MNDEDAYEMGVDLDSNDDRPVGEMTESDVEMFKHIFPGRRDPRVHEFSNLTHSDQAFAERRDDELLEAPEAGPSMVIEEGRVFKDLPKIEERPYKILHSYAQRCYRVVCDKKWCPWRICARKQNITGKWKITKVIDPHNCADLELTVRHRQLTSTLIVKRMMGILQEQLNMKVRTIVRTVAEIYGGYVITYGKAWRAKQQAWQMIYGDWESGYEHLLVLFNAIKAIFGRAFWCFTQCVEAFRHCRHVFSIDGTFLIGKYRGTLLIAISCDANNMLVPLAFALVERENNDSWGWFLRLVRIHVVGPGREVGVISDRHQGILNAVQEQIEGYAPLHHRWCTRHLAENLLQKDGVKDNFELFQVAARQLEDYYFQRKLEQVRSATNAEGTYQVEHRDGTTSDGEIRESRIHVVVLRDFKCTCRKPRQYHFASQDIESMIPHEFSVDTLVRTWSPRFVPFRDPREWPSYNGLKYIADPAYRWNKRGSRKRTRHKMTMDQVSRRTRHGRATSFLTDPEQNEWRPETHSFHLPFGEMIVTLQDCQKMLGLSIRGNAVTGPCVSEGWRARVAAFLGREAGQYSWGSTVLCFLYRQLCKACRWTSTSASVGGCVDWQPYEGEGALAFAVSVMCASDDDLYRMKCALVCFYAVEFHMPNRVARQFGIRQIWPTPAISTRVELHK